MKLMVSTALGLVAVAQGELGLKSLSGPPSTFMALPDLEAAAVKSRALYYTLQGQSSKKERTYSHTFTIGPALSEIPWVSVSIFPGESTLQASTLQAGLGVGYNSSKMPFKFSVSDSSNRKVPPSKIIQGERLGIGENSHGYVGAMFAGPRTGDWKLQVTIPNKHSPPPVIAMLVTIGGDTTLWSALETHNFVAGGKIPITSKLLGSGDSAGQEACKVVVQEPDGTSRSQNMPVEKLPASHFLTREYNHTDAFQTAVDVKKSGVYTARVETSGPNGIRHSFHSFRVVNDDLDLRDTRYLTLFFKVKVVSVQTETVSCNTPHTHTHPLFYSISIFVCVCVCIIVIFVCVCVCL
jgi:hypothetical protein